MVIDTSAVVAILREEPEGPSFLELLLDTTEIRMSMVSVVETAIVSLERGPAGPERAMELLDELSIEQVPLDAEQVELAIAAYARWGKGFHAARLNFGDCFSYALAKATGESLLFKGNDFSRTDIAVAVVP
jgi:ribonuclease VapC